MATSATRVALRSYRELVVWQRAMDLAYWVHALTERIAERDRSSLAERLGRSATSVPSIIAHGCGRRSPRDLARCAALARGSVREVETQLLLGIRFGLFRPGDVVEPLDLASRISRMLTVLIHRLARDVPRAHPPTPAAQ